MTINKNKQIIMIKNLPKSKKEITQSEIERGEKQLFRLAVIIDVLYALMIYQLFTFMPNPDIDNFGKEELYKVLTESYLNYTVIFIGLILVILYWGISNLQFGNLKRTNSTHSTLSILQIFSLMLYIYFVRLDAQFEGEVILMQLQSLFLAIAGFLSLWSWHYSLKNNLLSDAMSNLEKEKMYIKFMPEPIVSVITFPLAWFGAGIWTLGWLLLIPLGWGVKKYSYRMKFISQNKEDEKLKEE
jgi:hypothetical protein